MLDKAPARGKQLCTFHSDLPRTCEEAIGVRGEGSGLRAQGSGLKLRDQGLGLPVPSTRDPV